MSDESTLRALADEFVERLRAGERPGIEEYARRHPAVAERIRGLFPTLLSLEGIAGPAAPPSGTRFGPYRIEREIGRGGMGAVHEAVHLPLGKRVALKVLTVLGPGTEALRERFFREARTAAALHHTNIVPVFDVGEADGVPYYAMEFIEGRGLDRVLRELPPPSRTRSRRDPSSRPAEHFRWVAGLGVQAAGALAHAHDRGVVHRDIKPSNLLLDGHGVLFVADFGLARRAEDPALTQDGSLLGTPRYMSPEQAEGRGADHRSDLYGLGVTLYELLTRRPAFDGKSAEEVISQILHREPLPPRRLDSSVPRELETIVLKAMARRPEDRYPTARALEEDLSHWLRREPIRARRAGPVLRLRRWAQRNPALAASLALVFVALSGGLAVSLSLLGVARRAQNRAEANFQKALGAVDRLWTRVGERRLVPIPGMEDVRRELLEDALRFYRESLPERGDDPEVLFETALASWRVGCIQAWLGRFAQAEEDLGSAIGLLRSLAAGDPGRTGHREKLAEALVSLGTLVLHPAGRAGEAEAVFREALTLLGPLEAASPADLAVRQLRARAMHSLALLLLDQGRGAEAEEGFGQVIERFERLATEEPRETAHRHWLAGAVNDLAVALQARGALDEAEAAYRRGLDLRNEIFERAPETPDHRHFLADAQGNLAWILQARGRMQEAEEDYRLALGHREALTADFPRVLEYRFALGKIRSNLATLLQQTGRLAEADEELSRARADLEKLVAGHPEVPEYQSQLGATLHNLAMGRRDQGDRAEARRLYEGARLHQRAALDRSPQTPVYRQFLCRHTGGLGDLLIEEGKHEEVARIFEELHALFPDRPRLTCDVASYLARCATAAAGDPALGEDARRAAAGRYCDRAVELLRLVAGKDPDTDRWLREEPALAPLRGREDLQTLLRPPGEVPTGPPR